MALNKPSIISRVKELGSLESITADPNLGSYVRNVYPLTGQIGSERQRLETLGEGTFGRVNLEEVNTGIVATKYTLQPQETLDESCNEIAALKYLQGQPNVAQLIRLNTHPTSLPVNLVAPSVTDKLEFPALVMAAAKAPLSEMNLYKSWDDVYSAIVQILRGYHTLHERGIAHRDTKPGNMLMTKTGEVWITDFGMSHYQDTYIPSSEDKYTGTYWYSAPEILMNHEISDTVVSNDYFKGDSWAVGASIAHILRKRSPFMGDDIDEVLDHIFSVKGTPVASDGVTYTLYQTYSTGKGLSRIPQVKGVIQQRIKDFTVHKPADLNILKAVGEVVAGLLEYDPVKRLSIKEALQRLPSHNTIPVVAPRPIIISQYIKNESYIPVIAGKQIDILFNWLLLVVYNPRYSFHKRSMPFVLDRTGVYTFAFLHKYKDNPYVKTSNLQLIGLVGLLLASCLFDISEVKEFAYVEDIRDATAKAYTKEQIMECIEMYLVEDIEFYGRTFLDSLLQSHASLTQKEIETYAFFNYICFQKNLFRFYEDNVKKLQDLFEYLLMTEKLIPSASYLSVSYPSGVGSASKSAVRDFVRFATPSKGGRRTRKGKGRVKRRKQNKTLKARNG
jgi:serine/threonine protein kinase